MQIMKSRGSDVIMKVKINNRQITDKSTNKQGKTIHVFYPDHLIRGHKSGT